MSSSVRPESCHVRPGLRPEQIYVLERDGKLRPCGNCKVARPDLQKCSKCKLKYYCSRECQVDHWKTHKRECKRYSEMRQDGRQRLGKAAYKLQQKWLKRVQPLLSLLILQCCSKEDFNQQPPNFSLVIHVKFNFNYGAFMPLGPPNLYPNDQHHPDARSEIHSAYERAQKERESIKERTHCIDVVFENDTVSMMSNIDPDKSKDNCSLIGLCSKAYSHEDFCKLLQGISLPTSLYDRRAHEAITEANLSKQFLVFQKATVGIHFPWERFVLNAYRMNERQNLRGTHVVFVYFLFNYEPGRMKEFTRYEVLPMAEAKELVPIQIRRKYLCLDEPRRLPVIILEDWSKDLFAASDVVSELPAEFQHWTEVQSREVAQESFEQLKGVRFPLEGLEIPESIG